MGFLCEAERTDNMYALPSSKNGYKAVGTLKTKRALTDDLKKISLAAKIGDAVHRISSIVLGAEDNLDSSQRDDLFNRIPQSFWTNEASSLAASCQ